MLSPKNCIYLEFPNKIEKKKSFIPSYAIDWGMYNLLISAPGLKQKVAQPKNKKQRVCNAVVGDA